MTLPRIVRFGPVEADLKTGELRKGGGSLLLQPQLLNVLKVLLEHAGDLVTRDELQRQVWGGEVFVDFEHSLNKAITKLRRALDDDAGKPSYIETLERRGYRFIAPVQFVGDAAFGGTAMFRLAIPGRTVLLSEGTHLIGRDRGASVRIKSQDVSRHHALITISGQVAVICDLNSTNGTFLNGTRVAGAQPLQDGDQVLVGNTIVTFEATSPVAPTKPGLHAETARVPARLKARK